jgi:acetoin utilization protein AcuB
MLVRNWMSRDPVTVDVNDTMLTAGNLLRKHKIRGLPVMEKGRLVGVVTDRDLKKASASDANSLEIHELLYLLADLKIRDIMTRDPVTIPDDYTVEEAAEVLLSNKLSGAPVMDDKGDLAGVITQTDIFRVLISLTGVKNRGIQFAFQVEDRPGSIQEVTDILRAHGCRLVSILSTYEEEDTGHRHVYVRAVGCTRDELGALKEELASRSTLLYVADHREKKKEVFREYTRPFTGWWIVG